MALHISRRSYALAMGAATAAGLLCAAVIAATAGGDARTIGFAALALAVGSIITFIPALLIVGPDFWGIAVLLCGVGRGLAVLGLAFVLDHCGAGLMTRPLFFGALGGAVLILIAESAVAIRILSQLERRRLALKQPTTTG